jgi:outer membrane protein insertion porin family
VTYYTRLGSEIISLIHLQDGMLNMVGNNQLRMLDQFRFLRSQGR